MRNSPFQLQSSNLRNTIETNLAYKQHREKLRNVLTKSISPEDHLSQLRSVNRSLQRTKQFQQKGKQKEEDEQNMRLLHKFVEIQRGR